MTTTPSERSRIMFGTTPTEDPKLYAHRYQQSAYARQQQAIRNTLVAVTMANGNQVFVEPDQANKLLALPQEQRKEIPVSNRERLLRYRLRRRDYYRNKAREYSETHREKQSQKFAEYRATHKYLKMADGRQHWVDLETAKKLKPIKPKDRFLYLLPRIPKQKYGGAEV